MPRKKTITSEEKLDKIIDLLTALVPVIIKQDEGSTAETPKRRGRPPKNQREVKKPKSNINPLNGRPWIDFATLPESKKEKKDTATFDKKVWAGREPAKRNRPSNRIEIICGCGKVCRVLPEEVGAENKENYKCNNCIVKGKK